MIMDDIDLAILARLRRDSRTPVAELARGVAVARGTARMRLERLEASGIIAGYTIRMGGPHNDVRAHVAITVIANEQARTEAALARISAVQELLSVSGPHDLIAIVVATNTATLDEALDAIRALPGVASTLSSIVLSKKFER